MEVVNNLISDGRYTDAVDALKGSEKNKKNIILLSCLYRYLDRYDEEKDFVQNISMTFPYLEERRSWHERDLYNIDMNKSKLVPRKALNLEKRLFPKSETLDQLCIVYAATSGLFHLLVNSLESLKYSRYKDVPICILSHPDAFFSETQIHFLKTHFNIDEIKLVDKNIFPNEYIQLPIKGSMTNAMYYFKRHFPKYNVFFHLEPDVWIYDDRIIDEYVIHCEKHACAILQTPHLGIGCFSFSIDPNFFEKLIKTFNISATKYNSIFTEKLIRDLIHKRVFDLDFIKLHSCLYHMPDNEIPVVKDNVMVDPKTLREIGAFHIRAPTQLRRISKPIPTIEVTRPLNKSELEIHREIAGKIQWHGVIPEIIPPQYKKKFFSHFRTFPWKDKEELLESVRKMINVNVKGN